MAAATDDNGHSAAAAAAAVHPPLPRAALVTAAAAVQDTASRAREMFRRKAPLMEIGEGVARGQYKMASQMKFLMKCDNFANNGIMSP